MAREAGAGAVACEDSGALFAAAAQAFRVAVEVQPTQQETESDLATGNRQNAGSQEQHAEHVAQGQQSMQELCKSYWPAGAAAKG